MRHPEAEPASPPGPSMPAWRLLAAAGAPVLGRSASGLGAALGSRSRWAPAGRVLVAAAWPSLRGGRGSPHPGCGGRRVLPRRRAL